MNSLFRIFIAALILQTADAPLNGAPLTNTVPVNKDIYFQLRKRFGPPTNQFSANESISYKIGSFTTNEFFYRYFPPERSFKFKLYDQAGRAMEKTPLGRVYSRESEAPGSMRQASKLHGYSIPGVSDLFRADQMFVLTNKGIYELEISIRLWVQTTNRGTPNEVISYTRPNIGTNFQFGVITSPAIHVQIIKDY